MIANTFLEIDLHAPRDVTGGLAALLDLSKVYSDLYVKIYQ